MPTRLSMDPVVQVNINVGTNSVVPGVFDVGAIVGPTRIIGTVDPNTGEHTSYDSLYHRYYEFDNLAAMVEAGFKTTDPEYIAASKYFGVSPAPARAVVVYLHVDPTGDAYSAESTYAIGDYCTYNNKTYVCIVEIATPEAWNATHWEEVVKKEETPGYALSDAINKGAEFYAVYYCPIPGQSAGDIKSANMELLSVINSIDKGILFYGFTGAVEVVTADGSILSDIGATGSRRACGLYCENDISDAAGAMGLAMGMTRTHEGSSWAMCYKSIATATMNTITEANVEKIKGMNGNVYVRRTRSRAAVENGAVASGIRVDEVISLDQIKYDLQTGLFSLLADNPNKLPQTDSTNTLLVNEIYSILEGYYNAGVTATAPWRGTDIGTIATGDIIEHGYYAITTSFDDQSTLDRSLHKAPPITVLLCLSGSVESVVVNVNVQT